MAHEASPPTRGWTPDEPLQRAHAAGFPAHAGMDPRPASSRATRRGLPRPRGDGPFSKRVFELTGMASPPTRGWTRRRAQHVSDGVGFPAHAGMDPRRDRAPRLRLRLPRPRGDGPVQHDRSQPIARASPPTRGWTPVVDGAGLEDDGFPAHAGMDPNLRRLERLERRLPRPRGDGPAPSPGCAPAPSASPPTRGWTLDAGVAGSHNAASPPTRGWTQRVPRGDADDPGFPAHAGWTLRDAVEGDGLPGFPAHAGMDPRR